MFHYKGMGAHQVGTPIEFWRSMNALKRHALLPNFA